MAAASRAIVFDTETTGLSPAEGHRIIEIGMLEVRDAVPTGRKFHKYIDPEREVSLESTRITGITNEALQGMPKFAELVDEMLEFVGDAALVAHNASFDMNFLNHELGLLGRNALSNEVIDTLALARKAFPGARHSLDALCQRYGVDNTGRNYHGALLDAELLADVYLELTGGRQRSLGGIAGNTAVIGGEQTAKPKRALAQLGRDPLITQPTEAELYAHREQMSRLEKNLWYSDN